MNWKKFNFLGFLIFITSNQWILSQNLVPNPSFEDYISCPNSDGQIDFATGWKSYCVSSDYFNSCSTYPYPSVPENEGGFQYPAIGNGYAGVFTYGLREVLGCQLISPLNIGTEYFVSFKVNLAFNPNTFIDFGATNKIGGLFSTNEYPVSLTDSFQLNNFAHIYSTTIITDTLNWTIVNGSFIADSSYQYIYIGNFFDDSQTDTLTQLQNVFGDNNYCRFSYNFIDDIYVSTQPLVLTENELISKVKIYPTITNSFLNIIGSKNLKKIEIANSAGQIILEIIANKKEFKIDLSHFEEGLYFVNVLLENKTFYEKIIVIK